MSKKQTSEIHTLNKLARAISLAFSHILVEMQTGRGVKTRNLKLELSISTTIPERDKLLITQGFNPRYKTKNKHRRSYRKIIT